MVKIGEEKERKLSKKRKLNENRGIFKFLEIGEYMQYMHHWLRG